jgi:hypothetical protein
VIEPTTAKTTLTVYFMAMAADCKEYLNSKLNGQLIYTRGPDNYHVALKPKYYKVKWVTLYRMENTIRE